MSIQKTEITVSLGQLLLDPNNYRLNNGEDPINYSVEQIVELQSDIQKKLIRKNISDLESSMLENGFLEIDKIVVREIDNKGDLKKYLVVEGNRRTAAFKSLIINFYDKEADRFRDGFPQSLIDKSSSINVILVNGTEPEIQDYSRRLMGIRHVSGPKQWGAYQSSKLINDMFDSGQEYKEIGALLGMRPKEVQKKHEAYLCFHQMKRDPKYGCFAEPSLFSLFVEASGANKFFKYEWLGWDDDLKEFTHTDNLHRLYDAISQSGTEKPELNNPTVFRSFARNIEIKEVRSQIESGVKFQDVDYDFDLTKRIKRITEFTDFVDNFQDFSREEHDLLLDLRNILDRKFIGWELD
ncbi:ParB N-terminal domain-containing protein [Halioxenophilus sp. WMMB6]|uniref:ParB N-terminal domain-containing protein n=1 Tax=Halioxenophilus sp. WMMB6 TaxID=3073815 RepID=UPI00295F1C9C|nr:ParB N-terminal domain-containing protein [Halioxenophilus sp. WMMB6]